MKNGDHSIVLSVQEIGGSLTGPYPEDRLGDQGIESPCRAASSGLQVPGELVHILPRTRHTWCPTRELFSSKYASNSPAEMSNATR